jgi:AcrR family transcriptional regulator
MIRSQDETSEALLAAAHRLLATTGPESLTVRRIATEAGMSTMNVYSRFGGKDGVIDELYADGYRRLMGALDSVPTTDDIPGDLIRVAHAYRDFARANPTYYGIMFRGTVHGFSPSTESTELALSGLSSLVERVRLGQSRGVIMSREDGDTTDVAAVLWATCHGLVSLELDGLGDEYVSWSKAFDHGIHTMVDALCPKRAEAPTL